MGSNVGHLLVTNNHNLVGLVGQEYSDKPVNKVFAPHSDQRFGQLHAFLHKARTFSCGYNCILHNVLCVVKTKFETYGKAPIRAVYHCMKHRPAL